MGRYAADHEILLAGIGFNELGPHLEIQDLDAQKILRLPVAGQTFGMKKLPLRRCVGSFDLQSFDADLCPTKTELISDSKDLSCPACLEKTGFNPSFYFAGTITPQQQAYNATPHYVYMAYFTPEFLKVGISANARGIERLLEQGARAALVIGYFENADAARELEEQMCSQADINETMRASKKLELLANEPFDFELAKKTLFARASQAGLEPQNFHTLNESLDTTVLCLDDFYFLGEELDVSHAQIPEAEYASVCGGYCVGMCGSNLVFKQDGTYLPVSIKSWESHLIELYLGESPVVYNLEPSQMALL